jgi:hypothetical protein
MMVSHTPPLSTGAVSNFPANDAMPTRATDQKSAASFREWPSKGISRQY